jgi:26S proteasome regulatory subunit N8
MTSTAASTTTATVKSVTSGNDVAEVVIHPLVLLSAADHYHRVARGTRKRVVGVLLGSIYKGNVDATNSFAVPFEEDSRNPVSLFIMRAQSAKCSGSATSPSLRYLQSILCLVILTITLLTNSHHSTTALPHNPNHISHHITSQAVFYLDHNYLESMLTMFRKVNAKERVVGFYSTGPSIRPNDLRIHDIVQRYGKAAAANSRGTQTSTSAMTAAAANSIFCIIDIRPDRPALPVTAYKVVEEVSHNSTVQRSFAHLPVIMGAMEAEEVGVEHLLRDINDPTISTVASLIQSKLSGLVTLAEKLVQASEYLTACQAQGITANPTIVANLQTIWNLLPNLDDAAVRSMMVKTNDMHMAIYLGALIRSVMALHDLVNNKIRHGVGNDELENGDDDGEEKKEDKKEESKTDTKTAEAAKKQ